MSNVAGKYLDHQHAFKAYSFTQILTKSTKPRNPLKKLIICFFKSLSGLKRIPDQAKYVKLSQELFSKVCVLPIRIVQSYVSTIGPSSERRANARSVRRRANAETRQTLDTKRQTLSALAVHRSFYISICIFTLPTHHTTFILKRVVLCHRPKSKMAVDIIFSFVLMSIFFSIFHTTVRLESAINYAYKRLNLLTFFNKVY